MGLREKFVASDTGEVNTDNGPLVSIAIKLNTHDFGDAPLVVYPAAEGEAQPPRRMLARRLTRSRRRGLPLPRRATQ